MEIRAADQSSPPLDELLCRVSEDSPPAKRCSSNADVSALMPDQPPSLKYHPDTRHTDSCELRLFHLPHSVDCEGKYLRRT
ncbi:hypothetical protein NQZ68_007355, partial [Dissostichus eleginoides]